MKSKTIKLYLSIIFVLSQTFYWSCSQSTTGTFKDNRDNQIYKCVRIGSQTWMAENMNFVTSSGSWCYDDNSSNCATYGRLYNWKTAFNVCPNGWHLPTVEEWETLAKYISKDLNEEFTEGQSDWWTIGHYLKSKDFSPYSEIIPEDKYGFGALTGGSRDGYDTYSEINTDANFWTASNYRIATSWYYWITYESGALMKRPSHTAVGLSVRCIKDN